MCVCERQGMLLLLWLPLCSCAPRLAVKQLLSCSCGCFLLAQCPCLPPEQCLGAPLIPLAWREPALLALGLVGWLSRVR